MPYAAMILACLLASATDVGRQASPSQMISQATLLPAGSELTGQPYALQSAISSTADRRAQIEAVHAYWRLAEAAANYRLSFDYVQAIESIKARRGDESVLKTARAEAATQLRESLGGAMQAQHQLAETVRLPQGGPMPLPADKPLVGAYRTLFKELYADAGRTPPDKAWSTERILPLEYEAIQHRAQAVEAADDAWIAAGDEYREGRGDAAAVAARARELLAERRAFVRMACRYNHDIADYGLLAMGLNTPPSSLTAVLIGAQANTTQPASVAGQPVRMAGAIETIPESDTRYINGLPAKRNEPTPAPPKEEWEWMQRMKKAEAESRGGDAASNNGAAPADFAPKKPALLSGGNDEIDFNDKATPLRTTERRVIPIESLPAASPDASQDSWMHHSVRKPPIETRDNEPGATQGNSKPWNGTTGGATGRTSTLGNSTLGNSPAGNSTLGKSTLGNSALGNSTLRNATQGRAAVGNATPNDAPPSARLSFGGDSGGSALASAPLYAAWADSMPATQAKQITLALQDNNVLPKKSAQPLSLTDCLNRDAGGDRQKTVGAYWLVARRVAECQSLAQRVGWLEQLAPIALERRLEPSGATEMLRLRSAQLASQAALDEARVDLIEAQFALALRVGMVTKPAWPIASTAPHSGDYLLRLDAQPVGVAESWPVKRLAAAIPHLGESVRVQAKAVVDADAARAEAVRRFHSRSAGTIVAVLDAIAKQAVQTQTFVAAVADYNQAIAEYAATVLPANTSASDFAAALVTKPF